MNEINPGAQRTLLNGLTLSLLICALAFVPAQAQKRPGGRASQTKAARTRAAQQGKSGQPAVAYYSCPMHPSVKAKSAGKCPQCGMKLRAVYQDEATAASAGASNSAGGATTSDALSAETTATAGGQASKMNIPDIELLDQDGRKIHFYTDLVRGKTVAINFIFTTCTTICPPLGATFARVQKELGDKVGRDVNLISISVDPAIDTPERLKAWGAKFRAGDGWTFVTGHRSQVDELLRALGASSARREDHSPTVLIGNDARGTWTRTYGLAKPSQLVQIINDIIEGKTASTSTEAAKNQ